MSQSLETRVLAARPLEPASRLALLLIARMIPDGQTEIAINRAAFAREWEMTPDRVRRALLSAEYLGLVKVGGGGRIAFTTDELPLNGPVSPEQRGDPADIVLAADRRAGERRVIDNMTTRIVMDEFAKMWQARYRRAYVFQHAKDSRLAKPIADSVTLDDLRVRLRGFFDHPDPYYARCAHAFGLFAMRINSFGESDQPKKRGMQTVEESMRAVREARRVAP